MNLGDLVLIHHRRRRRSWRRVRFADGRQEQAAEAEDENEYQHGGDNAHRGRKEFAEVGVHAG